MKRKCLILIRRSLKTILAQDDRHEVIQDSDLLLFRGCGFVPRLISAYGRSAATHAAKAAWWGDDLFCLEVREWYGGRAVTLASQVRRYPGRIDVYRANPNNRWPEYGRARATAMMRHLAGCDYNYLSILRVGMTHMPFIRLFLSSNGEDHANGNRPVFCSDACAMADRIGGGVDPVPHLADRMTEPGDLERSPFYDYQFTLWP